MHFTHIALGTSMTLLLPLHIVVGRFLEKKRIRTRIHVGRKDGFSLKSK